MEIFDPIARGNVDIASDCEMMSYSHVDHEWTFKLKFWK